MMQACAGRRLGLPAFAEVLSAASSPAAHRRLGHAVVAGRHVRQPLTTDALVFFGRMIGRSPKQRTLIRPCEIARLIRLVLTPCRVANRWIVRPRRSSGSRRSVGVHCGALFRRLRLRGKARHLMRRGANRITVGGIGVRSW